MATSLRQRFGLRVKELRLASHVSQETFADAIGYARSYVSRIERGGANCSLDAIQVLADALNVQVHELFQPDNDGKVIGTLPFGDQSITGRPGP